MLCDIIPKVLCLIRIFFTVIRSFMTVKRIIRSLICAVLAVACALSLSACGETKESSTIIFAMDTQMTLKAYGKNAETGLKAASSVIESMDRMLDPQLESSKTYELNHAQGKSIVVPGQVARMIETAQDVYKKSGGALDPTIYPLIQRWAIRDGKGYVPSDEEVYLDLSRLCFDDVMLTSFPSSGSYTLQMPSYAELTFAALAKGCASDYAIEAMKNTGVESGIISLGGNVRTLGLKPNGDRWSVAVQDPNNTSAYIGILTVGEKAVVTSGGYQRFFKDQRGRTYHHILNPKTGFPANNTLSSVTVISDDGTLADALSTALFIMGQSNALQYWRDYGMGKFDLILVTTENMVICTTGIVEDFELTNTRDYTVKFTE